MRFGLRLTATIALIAGVATANAATPPPLVNYQGVLRDSGDKPLSGSYDVLFRFMDAATAGNEIMTDQHAAATSNAVTVSGGLFNAQLGSGTITDGTGPGTYTSLDAVFRDYGAVWLEVKVGAETLSPRTQIQSAAYALNASNAFNATNALNATTAASATSAATATDASQLNGQPASFYIDTSGTRQVKYGALHLEAGVPGFATLDAIAQSPAPYAIYAQQGSGRCGIGVGTTGIDCGADVYGAYLHNDLWYSYAYVPSQNFGIWAVGSNFGGRFSDFSGSWAAVDYGSYKIVGSGSVSFIQNHPTDASKVVVYAAPEGDEVAVYTRGSARLMDGEVRVALGETFALVANPDIGLTVSVTPRGEWSDLYVVGVSTNELVVRSRTGTGNATFDYIVWGLRIGFEEQSIVQPKERDSKIPSMHQHEQFFAADPSLRRFTSLARFKAMEAMIGGRKEIDLSRARKLREAVGVFAYQESCADLQPAIADPALPSGPPAASQPSSPARQRRSPPSASTAPPTVISTVSAPSPTDRGALPTAPPLEFEVVEPVDSGDVLALDPLQPGKLRRAASPSDPNVAGIADSASTEIDGVEKVAVVSTNYATVNVDAQFGSIHPGDLLVSSSTPGHAMVARSPLPGTVIGKALQPIESGTGVIRVLLLSR